MALRREKIIKEAHDWYQRVRGRVRDALFKEVIGILIGSNIYEGIRFQDTLRKLQTAKKPFHGKRDRAEWQNLQKDLIGEILRRNFIKDYSDEEILFFFGALYRIARAEEEGRKSLKR